MNRQKALPALMALAVIASMLGASVAAAGSGSSAAIQQDAACPHDLAHWRQNPGAWPVDSLTLGNDVYDQAALLTLFFTAVNGDASVALAQELAATKLNAALGLDASAVADAIAAADAALSQHEGWLPFGIGYETEAGQSMLATQDVLSLFNSGALTPGCEPTPPPPVAPPPAPPPISVGGGECPLSQGFWKNHPAVWPVDALTLGGAVYSQAELLTILHTPAQGDASIILAYQLIAARLNIAAGSDPTPVADLIAQADALLAAFDGKLPYGVAPSTSVGQQMVSIAATLDDYNNERLTPDCGTAIVVEGPVTAIELNIIIINDIRIWLDPDDPLLTVIQIGDVLRVEGHYEEIEGVVVLVAAVVVFVEPEVIEGPVTEIRGNIIVINNIEIWLDPDDPLLLVIRIGDTLRVEGNYAVRGGRLVVVVVVLLFVFDDDDETYIIIDDDDDYECKNPPPPWAPAHGWRRKCGG